MQDKTVKLRYNVTKVSQFSLEENKKTKRHISQKFKIVRPYC